MSTNEALENYYAQLNEQNDPWESVECRQQNPDLWWDWDDHSRSLSLVEMGELKQALTICNRCPMRTKCLELGLRDDDLTHGIWGGYLVGERLAMMSKTRYAHERRDIAKAARLRALSGVPAPTTVGE